MTEKLSFDLDVASNNLKKALNEVQTQISKIEQKSGSIKFDPIFGNQFVADAKKADAGLSSVTSTIKDASKETESFGTAASVAIGGLVVSASLAALGAIKSFAAGSIQAFSDQELAIQRLNAALASTGTYTDATSQSLQLFASNIQNTTRFSDDATLGALGLLQSLTRLNSDGLQRAGAGAADLAARFGKDLPSVVETLGRAFNGQTRGLKEFGIQFKDTGDTAKNFEGIMSLVEKRFAGSAQKDLDTYAGKLEQLKNKYNEAQEAVGRAANESGLTNKIINALSESFENTAKNVDSFRVAFLSTGADASSSLQKISEQAEATRATLNSLTDGKGANAGSGDAIKQMQAEVDALDALAQKRFQIEAQRNQNQANSNQENAGQFKDITPEQQARLDSERKTQLEITAIRAQGDEQRQSNEEQLRILAIENNGVRAEEEINFINEQAIAQADLKYQNKVNENALIQNETERQLANDKANEERRTAISKAEGDKRLASKKNQIAIEKQLEQEKLNAFNSFADLGLALSKQGSVAYKAIGTAQATINTYVAANRALAELPAPVAPFAAAAAIATGLANVARINSIQAFEQGGIVPGNSFKGDKVLARVNSGEVILNEAQQDVVASKLTGSQSSPVIKLYLNSREIAYAIREEVQAGFKLA